MSWLAVPSEMKASPGRMAPMPTAPTAASPPPAATTTSRGQSEFVGDAGQQAGQSGSMPSASGGNQRGIDAARRERFGRPAPRRLVEPPGSRRVAHVGALFAGQT